MGKQYKYIKILKKNNQIFSEIARKTYVKYCNKGNDVFVRLNSFVFSPVIYNFVYWVLEESKKKGFRRLYFLSRDGYIFYKVAMILCDYLKIDIECRYLYCSRIAWRFPQYHLMGTECLDYICIYSMDITPRKIFERVFLSKEEQERIFELLGIDKEKQDEILSTDELHELKKTLSKCNEFLECIYSKSKLAYENTISYLKQEKLMDDEFYALVDTGWTGSMQLTLFKLLKHYNSKQKWLNGFYFGMYDLPKGITQDGYYTYYFNKKSNIKNKVYFNNNLFECMCCSKDGMTIGYEKKYDNYTPVFSNLKNLNSKNYDMDLQVEIVSEFTRNAVEEYIPTNNRKDRRLVYKLLKAFMYNPTREEANSYGDFLFSDDVSEKHVQSLAPIFTNKEMMQNDIIPLLYVKLFNHAQEKSRKKSFWIEGSLARSSLIMKGWHRLNIKVYHYIRYLIKFFRKA